MALVVMLDADFFTGISTPGSVALFDTRLGLDSGCDGFDLLGLGAVREGFARSREAACGGDGCLPAATPFSSRRLSVSFTRFVVSRCLSGTCSRPLSDDGRLIPFVDCLVSLWALLNALSNHSLLSYQPQFNSKR